MKLGHGKDALFSKTDNLRHEVEHHRKTISDRVYKDVVIHTIPESYSNSTLANHL